RVVDGVHDDAAHGRALALPPHAAGLAPADVRLLGVADLADRGAAPGVDVADLAGGHPQLGELALLGHELDRRAGGPGDLGSAAGPQLDGVHHGADRDVPQRHVVAGLDVRAGAVLDPVALLEPVRCEDVALLAVGVVQQCDAGRAVGVVLDVRHGCGHAVLVVTTEVDHAVGALVTATLVPGGDLARGVPAAALGQRADQRLLRRRAGDLDEVGHGRAAAARRRRLVLTDCHGSDPSSGSPASAGDLAEDVDGALAQRDDRALGVLALADAEPRAAGLARTVRGVHRGHLDVEDLLIGVLDLGLVRARVDLEGVLALVDQVVALLRDDRLDDDLAGVLGRLDAHFSSSWADSAPGAAFGPARNVSSAPEVNTTSSLTRTS